jgi:ribosomal protein L29
MSKIAEIYDQDFYVWAMKNAELIRQGRFSEMDAEHLAEELEEIMGNTRRELYRRLRVLLAHLLKWQYQPNQRSSSWSGTIRIQRLDIARLLKQSPSLRRFVEEEMLEAYRDAIELASDEARKPISDFPADCPFTSEQVMDKDFWPD